MAMDRKNKKAAQVAAAAAAGNERGERSERGGKDGRGGRGGNPKRDGHAAGAGTTGNRNPLLAGGSTAPTRLASSTPTGRPPMSLKTTLSPSAPAPPLASFGSLDDLEDDGVQLASAPAQGKQSSQDNSTTAVPDPSAEESESKFKSKSPEPLPASAPRSVATPTKIQDFGPIGSPPTSISRPTVNGVATTFSPGTSPRPNGINVAPGTTAADNSAGFLSSSPFSAPGAQSVFLSGSYTGGGGMAASLGSGLAMMGGKNRWGGESPSAFAGLGAASVQQGGFDYEEYGARGAAARSGLGLGRPVRKYENTAVEDEDLEDFLPSSLTDLLTPEERSRRMSRSNSGQAPGTLQHGFGGGELVGSGGNAGLGGGGHRYSRSVPAPSLLGDIKSIWSENSASALPSSPPTHRGTPSQSFLSRPNMGEDMLSMSIGSAGSGMMGLSPSNASAAFLPGLHSHYLNSKAKQAQAQAQALGLGGLGKVNRVTTGSMYGASGTSSSGLANSYLLGGGGGGGAGSGLSGSPGNQVHTHTDARTNTTHTYRTTPSPFDLTQHLLPIASNGTFNSSTSSSTTTLTPNTNASPNVNNIPNHPHTAHHNNYNNPNHHDDGPHLLSPSARALQSHAPGQSLPQGLAAGYSRIHAQPPPPTLHSPGSFVGTPPTTDAGVPSSGPYGGWRAPLPQVPASPPTSTSAGLDAMFSRLSYSAAAAAKTSGVGSVGATTTMTQGSGSGAGLAPPGLTRNVSAGRYNLQGPLGPGSPLSGPVVTRDDDDELFSMDG
ncbi:hypothetical protein C0991_010792 [Blastosporella zonata]|nr:hypothetical protein C0991_010792 [Blastosporella zonata]